jgi:hypothetical protein
VAAQRIPVEEILKKQAEGYASVTARAMAYRDAIKETADQTDVLSKAIGSSTWPQWSAQLSDQANKLQRVAAVSQNLLYLQSAQSGALQKQAIAMTAITRQRDQMGAKVRNETTAADLSSGAYAKQAAAMGGLNRQYMQQQRQMAGIKREEDLTARFGAAGGLYARHEGAIKAGAVVGAGAALTVGAMANRGFQGTIEQNRADLAGKFLDRQVASIFKPLKEMETGLKASAAKWLGGLNGSQQNALMYGGGAVIGSLGLAGLVKGLGFLRNVGGIAAAQAAASGVAPMGGVMGAASGASAAAMKALIPIAIGAVAQSQGYGGYAVAGMGAFGAVRGGMAARAAGTSMLRGSLKGGAIGAGITLAGAAMEQGMESGPDYYHASRKMGNNKLVATLDSIQNSAAESISGWLGYKTDEFKARQMKTANYTPEVDEKHRRDVAIAQSGYEEQGSAYERIQSAASVMDMSEGTETPRPATPTLARPGTPGEGREVREARSGLDDFTDALKRGADWLDRRGDDTRPSRLFRPDGG